MNTEQQTSLFRENALKHLATPEQLDQLIQVVSPRSRYITIALTILLLFFLIWLVAGSIPTRAEGPGILLAAGGEIYKAIAPDGPSIVNHINIKSGDKVTKGQILATLSRPDLDNEIAINQKNLAELTEKYRLLQNSYQKELDQRHTELTEQQQFLDSELSNNKKKLLDTQALLNARQIAFSKGLETRQNLNQTVQEFYSITNDVAGYNDKMAQLDISFHSFEENWQQQLRQLDLTILDERTKLLNLQARKVLSTFVTSPVNGTITSIQANIGSIVKTGDAVVNIAEEGKIPGLDALVYLPPQVGKRVKAGMLTLVSPTVAEKAEYGSIYGKVISVAAFPVTPNTIESSLQNSELVKKFTEREAPIEVRIHLEKDSKTFSGLKWSSSRGPRMMITPGTFVTSMVTVRQQAPITLIIPAFKKLMGVE